MRENRKIRKGKELELNYSKRLLSHQIPILIAPQILRERGLGQIDICYLDTKKDLGYIIELKCGMEDVSTKLISRSQMRRLRNSADWLSQAFDKSFVIKQSTDH